MLSALISEVVYITAKGPVRGRELDLVTHQQDFNAVMLDVYPSGVLD
jgi:hypothetical protein